MGNMGNMGSMGMGQMTPQMMMQMQQMQMQRMAQIQQTGMGGPGMDGSAMGAPGMARPQNGVTPAGHHMMYNQPNGHSALFTSWAAQFDLTWPKIIPSFQFYALSPLATRVPSIRS